jgi:hypothetical protein
MDDDGKRPERVDGDANAGSAPNRPLTPATPECCYRFTAAVHSASVLNP